MKKILLCLCLFIISAFCAVGSFLFLDVSAFHTWYQENASAIHASFEDKDEHDTYKHHDRQEKQGPATHGHENKPMMQKNHPTSSNTEPRTTQTPKPAPAPVSGSTL